MSHPIRFDDQDPILARVRELALDLPDAKEKISHGHPAFYTTNVFAYYGGTIKIDGEWVRHDRSLLVLLDPAERAALLEEERSYAPAYLGTYGWVGIHLSDNADWDEIGEFLDTSFRLTAGPRRVAALDNRHPD